MVKLKPSARAAEAILDGLFAALADRTRRQVLADLSAGERPVTELAAGHAMSLPGFMKHLAVLEAAGLIERAKNGRVVNCALAAAPMEEAAAWLAEYEQFWAERLDALGRYLTDQEDPRPSKRSESKTRPRAPRSASGLSPRKKSAAPGPFRRR